MKRFAFTVLGVFVMAGCEGRITSSDPPQPTIDAELRQNMAAWGVMPVGPMPAQNPALVALGQALFFDKILSGNKDVACATCHHPEAFLGDGLSLAVGTGGSGVGSTRTPGPGRQFVSRHAPSLLNSGLGLFYMFWDGRLTNFGFGTFVTDSALTLPPGLPNILAAQALLPVLDRREMRGEPGDSDVFGNPNELAQFEDGQTSEIWRALMERLLAIPEYEVLFRAAFPNSLRSQLAFRHAAEALAAFQMEAFTKARSPFDRYLDRDDAALTPEQKRGARLFFGEAQCVTCHAGPLIGGQSFANTGVPQIGPGMVKEAPLDLGRGEIDNFEFYRFAFRSTPLRNVELTAPYMHDGAYATLEAVIRHYNNVPLAAREYDVSQLTPSLRDMHHGEEATIAEVLSTLDGRFVFPLGLTEDEMGELVAFLKSLTDPTARDLRSLIPRKVPSGLPVPE